MSAPATDNIDGPKHRAGGRRRWRDAGNNAVTVAQLVRDYPPAGPPNRTEGRHRRRGADDSSVAAVRRRFHAHGDGHSHLQRSQEPYVDQELVKRVASHLDHQHGMVQLRPPSPWQPYRFPQPLQEQWPVLARMRRLRVSPYDMRWLGMATKVSGIIALDAVRHSLPVIGQVPCSGFLMGAAQGVVANSNSQPPGKLASFNAAVVNSAVMPLANPLVVTPVDATVRAVKDTEAWSTVKERTVEARAARVSRVDSSLRPYLSTTPVRFLRGNAIGSALAAAGAIAVQATMAKFGVQMHGVEAEVITTAGLSWGAVDASQRVGLLALRQRRRQILARDPRKIGPMARVAALKERTVGRGHHHDSPVDELPIDVPWWKVPFQFRQPSVRECRERTHAAVPGAQQALEREQDPRAKLAVRSAFGSAVTAIKNGMFIERPNPAAQQDQQRERFVGCPVDVRLGLDLEQRPGGQHIGEAVNALGERAGVPVSTRAMAQMGRTTPVYQRLTTVEAKQARHDDHHHHADGHGHGHGHEHECDGHKREHGHAPQVQAARKSGWRQRVGWVLAGAGIASLPFLNGVGTADAPNIAETGGPPTQGRVQELRESALSQAEIDKQSRVQAEIRIAAEREAHESAIKAAIEINRVGVKKSDPEPQVREDIETIQRGVEAARALGNRQLAYELGNMQQDVRNRTCKGDLDDVHAFRDLGTETLRGADITATFSHSPDGGISVSLSR